MEKRVNKVEEIIENLKDRLFDFDLENNEDVEIEKLSKIEKIQLAIIISRRQLEYISDLIESNRNETRPVMVEENRQKIERLIQEHREYDEMTNAAYNDYYNYLNSYIELLGSRKEINSLSTIDNLIARREVLLEIGRTNPDIVFLMGKEQSNKNKR